TRPGPNALDRIGRFIRWPSMSSRGAPRLKQLHRIPVSLTLRGEQYLIQVDKVVVLAQLRHHRGLAIGHDELSAGQNQEGNLDDRCHNQGNTVYTPAHFMFWQRRSPAVAGRSDLSVAGLQSNDPGRTTLTESNTFRLSDRASYRRGDRGRDGRARC